MLCSVAGSATAGSGEEPRTHLLDLYLGSGRSDIAHGLRRGGYELADGTPVSFDAWYRPRRAEVTILFLSQLSDHFGLTWGLSTGANGQKYSIDPALHLGLIWQVKLSHRSTLTLGVQTVWAGRLRERSCTADYGPFGVEEVNCRLAATEIPPAETLGALVNIGAEGGNRVTLRLEHRF